MIVLEVGHLPFCAVRERTDEDVPDAAFIAEIIEAVSVRSPDRRGAVVFLAHDRHKTAGVAVEHPYLAAIGGLGPRMPLAELKPALLDTPYKQNPAAVRRQRRAERRRIEKQLLSLARTRRDENRAA